MSSFASLFDLNFVFVLISFNYKPFGVFFVEFTSRFALRASRSENSLRSSRSLRIAFCLNGYSEFLNSS